MAAGNTVTDRRIGSALKIGFGAIILFFLATMSIYAAEETVYEKVIAHGGGSYKGFETTNSVEAIKQSISNGYKIIELDMELSADHKIIMLHDWDRTAAHYYGVNFTRKLSQSSFCKLSVHGELEVLTFDKLAVLLEKNPEIRIVSDTKGDNIELLETIRDQYPEMVCRIIPQIYDYEQWSDVKELGYSDVILTLYAMEELDFDKLDSFIKEHDIYAVTMPDYLAEKGICRRLSDSGAAVYVHSVSDYEEALNFMKQGACGVYSGSLLPEEFEGIESDYYLTVSDTDGAAVKLTDERIADWRELAVHGRKPQDSAVFYLDGSGPCDDDTDFSGLEPGKHMLTVEICENEEQKGTLTYYLLKDPGELRVLHRKYEYRIDGIREQPDFYTVMQSQTVRPEVAEILERSLIAREGEYTFYINGKQGYYMNGGELLPVQKGNGGKLFLPLGTSLEKLGADSVVMDRRKDIIISYHQEKSMIMANTGIVRRGFQITRLNTPVTLYLNKAMAGGEFYRAITGRDYLEKDDKIIILPAGEQYGEAMKRELLDAAGKLFR